MKLIIAIVQDRDIVRLEEELTSNHFRMTKLASTGGFLKSGNTTVLIGLEDEKIPMCMRIIERCCKSRETTTNMMSVNMPGTNYMTFPVDVLVGGATVLVIDVEKYVRF